MDQKFCKKCQKNKPLTDFTTSSRFVKKEGCVKTYINNICKLCHSIKNIAYLKRWRENNPEYIKEYNKNYVPSEEVRANSKISSKKYYNKHQEHYKEVNKIWYQNNKEKHLSNGQKWRVENPEKAKIHYTKSNRKRQTDPVKNFAMRVRCSIRKSFNKTGLLKRETTFEMLGYSNIELHNHLNPYLDKPCECCLNIILDLKCSNIDHIIPMCTAQTEDDVVRLNQLSNLRLICKKCNSDKISDDLKTKEKLFNEKIL